MTTIISRIITYVVLLVLLTFTQDGICAAKKNRAGMALLVPISIIYSVFCCILVLQFYHQLEAGIGNLLEMGSELPLPGSLGELLSNLNVDGHILVMANLIILLLFLPVKLVSGQILKRVWKTKELIESTSSFAYTYDEDTEGWYIKRRWENYREFLRAVRWGMVIAAGVILGAWEAKHFSGTTVWAFPCAAVLIFNELSFFFNGPVQKERGYRFSGEDADSHRVGMYFRIREIYEYLFPNAILAAQTGFETAGKESASLLVNQLKESEDKADRLTADYYLAGRRFTNAEPDGVRMTCALMHKTNVICMNPYYRDLSDYVTLPIVHTLASGRKCVVITGRMSSGENLKAWISELLKDYTHMPSLWNVEDLTADPPNCEIGILRFPELYNSDVITRNRAFFQKTDFVIIEEPSVILNTGQTALSILAQEFGTETRRPTYLVCDRIVDGLVDTISHVLRTEFTTVIAPPSPRCIYSGISWDVNGDYRRQELFNKESGYLGCGVELAAAAVKNQIPQVNWYAETKVPLQDVQWIAGQHYPVICQYMNQPIMQSTINDKIQMASEFWDPPQMDEYFSIVEDEFDHMYAVMRLALTRGRKQAFVNVLSENYMLRDYMRYNQQMFLSDPTVVPSVVPDYAKSARNTLIKLLLMMLQRELSEKELLDEFHLVGCDGLSAEEILEDLLPRYTRGSLEVLKIRKEVRAVAPFTQEEELMYSINKQGLRNVFGDTLETAFFILEEEESGSRFVDAKFFNHVTQCVIEGQLVTYNGKYYQARYVSPSSGVVLRRASNLFDERHSYRQIRQYRFPNSMEKITRQRAVGDIIISNVEKDLQVRTTGYLDLTDLHDLENARLVDLSGDPHVDHYSRAYHNKEMLKVTLPGTSEDVRYTICLLLMEAFRTILPDGYPYIAVTTQYERREGDKLSAVVYPIEGELENDVIYIIEDSDIDMGILGAVERNLKRIMEILADYIEWHLEKMDETPVKKETPKKPMEAVVEKVADDLKMTAEETESDAQETEEPIAHEESKEQEAPAMTDYQKNCFLKFGGESIDDKIRLTETLEYFRAHGWTENALTEARKRDAIDHTLLDTESSNTCDFCGIPLSGVSYVIMNDGRVCCNDCAASAISTVDELRELFGVTLELMETFYRIQYRDSVDIVMADARTIAKGVGRLFVPSKEYTERVVGYAAQSHGNYSLLIENGSPRLATTDTIVHEMTHIWQYQNWDQKEVERIFQGKDKKTTDLTVLTVHEGMAMWAAVQYMYQIGETRYAAWMEAVAKERTDIYGLGFNLFADQYPIVRDSSLVRYTPFTQFPPIEPMLVKAVLEELV